MEPDRDKFITDVYSSIVYRTIKPEILEPWFIQSVKGAIPSPKKYLRYEYSLEHLVENMVNIFEKNNSQRDNLRNCLSGFQRGVVEYMEKYPNQERIPGGRLHELRLSEDVMSAAPLPLDNPYVADLIERIQDEPYIETPTMGKVYTTLAYYFMNMVHDLENESNQCAEMLMDLAGKLNIWYLGDLLAGVFNYKDSLQREGVI